MVTYKEYLTNLITENVADMDTVGDLVVALESAETIEDLDVVADCIIEVAKAEELTLKEQQDASGASTASDDGRSHNNEYELEGYESAEKKILEGIKMLGDGDLEKGYKLCLQASQDAAKTYSSCVGKLLNSKDISKSIKELETDMNELKDECKSGDITASKAKTMANKLHVKMKLIAKQIKAEMAKGTKKEKATKESALNAIFESASEGILEDSEIDFLVNALD